MLTRIYVSIDAAGFFMGTIVPHGIVHGLPTEPTSGAGAPLAMNASTLLSSPAICLCQRKRV